MGDPCDKFHSLEEGEAVYCGTGRVGLLPLCRGRLLVAPDHPTGAVWQHRGLSETFCPAGRACHLPYSYRVLRVPSPLCQTCWHNGLNLNREQQLEEHTTQQMNGK